MREHEVAQTILEQMNGIDRNLVWCMGVKSPTVTRREGTLGGLMFDVSGLSFKGRVYIELDPSDTYIVTLVVPKKRLETYPIRRMATTWEQVSRHEQVYVEDLMPLLESLVENRSGKRQTPEEMPVVNENNA